MPGPRHFPGSSTLCSLGLPPHVGHQGHDVGRGDAAVVRSTRSESLIFDLITKLLAERDG